MSLTCKNESCNRAPLSFSYFCLDCYNAGEKQDKDKPKYSLVEWDFLEAIAETMTFGEKKYPSKNYMKLESEVIYNSMMRHLRSHIKGDLKDEESGKPHLHHFVSNVMMFFMLENKKGKG